MKIDRISDFFNTNKLNQMKKGTAKPNKSGKVKTDKIPRNPEKVQGQNYIPKVVKYQMSKIPEIRQTKINDIKGKLARNYYAQNHVMREIAGKMSSSPELITTMANQNKQSAKTSPGYPRKLSVFFNRMDRKFYSSIEILDEVAKKIILDLNNKS